MNLLQLRIILRFKILVTMVAFLFLSSAHGAWSRARYMTDQTSANEQFYFRVDAGFQQRWIERFSRHQEMDEYTMSNAVERFTVDVLMLVEQFPSEGRKVVEAFGALRRYMPEEFRWALAALEIEAGIIRKGTLEDLKSAALRAGFVDETGRSGFLSKGYGTYRQPFAIYCPPVKGESRTREALIFETTETVSFLMSKWHSVVALDPDSNSAELEKKRIEWINDVVDSSAKFLTPTIEEIVKAFNNPAMVHFTSADRSALFLENALELVNKLDQREGRYKVNEDGDIYFDHKLDKRRGYGKVREIVGQWFYSDISFLVTHLPTLQKQGFFSFAQLFEKQMPETTINLLKDLFLKKALNSESQISAGLILLNQKTGAILETAERDVVNETLVATFTSAKEQFGLVGISSKRFESIRTENEFFYTALESFYQHILDHGGLSSKQALAIFEKPTVMTKTLKKPRFEKIEDMRLQVVAKSLSYETYKNEMLKRLAKGTSFSHEEQIRIANMLSKALAQSDRAAAGKLIRERFKQGLFGAKVNWEAENGWPVQLMMRLNPADPDMIDHLVSVAAEQRIDSVFPVGDVLGYLIKLKVSSPRIRDFLLRHLRFPEAGDSVNYFRTLIKLHPELASEIIAVVYRFHKDVPKLIPMLEVLVSEVLVNPALLKAIVDDIAKDPRKIESSRVYNKFNLAELLVIQVEKHKRSSCRKFYSAR